MFEEGHRICAFWAYTRKQDAIRIRRPFKRAWTNTQRCAKFNVARCLHAETSRSNEPKFSAFYTLAAHALYFQCKILDMHNHICTRVRKTRTRKCYKLHLYTRRHSTAKAVCKSTLLFSMPRIQLAALYKQSNGNRGDLLSECKHALRGLLIITREDSQSRRYAVQCFRCFLVA